MLYMTDDVQSTRVSSLEVFDRGSSTAAHPAPLLFVHGAWHAAWCWDQFLDFFAEKGYRALSVSLRGHGASATSKRLRWCTLADYVDDVESVAATLPATPVVIGHSLGGFIVQKYLESNDTPAGVLMASAPPQGSRGFLMRLMRRYPWYVTRSLATGDFVHGFATPAVARELFFSTQTPERDVARYAAKLGNESQRVTLDTLVLDRLKPARVTAPVLVLGAVHDGAFPRAEVDDTARTYCTDAEFFDMGHDMMLEPGWETVAERIHDWLGARGL
jgi:pimeloyl-ACP methyl ester carboxylesterase